MKIRFVKDHKVKQGDGKGPEYKAGETHSFNGAVAETYARKYVARRLAVDVTNEPQPARAEPAPARAAEPERPAEQPAEESGTGASAEPIRPHTPRRVR